MQSMQEYKDFISKVRESIGVEEFTPDEDGLISVRVENKYNLNLQYIEESGNILCFVEICTLPADTHKDVYRDLLSGGLFGKETAGGYFALEPQTEAVIYNYLFTGDRYLDDVEEFVRVLERILELCDMWHDRMLTTADNDNARKEKLNLNSLNFIL